MSTYERQHHTIDGTPVNVIVFYDSAIGTYYARAPGNGGAAISKSAAVRDALSAWNAAGKPKVYRGDIPNGWREVTLSEYGGKVVS